MPTRTALLLRHQFLLSRLKWLCLYGGMSLIELSVFGCDIHIECMNVKTESLLSWIYACFKRSVKHGQITYRVTRDRTSEQFLIEWAGIHPEVADDEGEFLYKFENDLTI